MGMAYLPACMSEHNVCIWCCWEPEEGVGSPQTRVNDSCEMSCRCWESNQGPPEEHPVFLTAEPLLQPGQLRFRSVLKTGAHITEAYFFFYSAQIYLPSNQTMVWNNCRLWLFAFVRRWVHMSGPSWRMGYLKRKATLSHSYLSKIFMCVCVHEHVSVCLYVHMCTCLCDCVSVCAHAYACGCGYKSPYVRRSTSSIISCLLDALYLEPGSLTGSGSHHLRLAGQ